MDVPSSRREPSRRGRREERLEHSASRSVSVRERESSLHSSLQQSLQSSALQRDVKGLGDAQARLVRVIEDISQELTQRLAKHDLQLEQLVEKQQSLQETFRHLQTEEAAWRRSLEAEYLRLRTSDGNFATKLNFLESKIQQLEARPAGFAVEPKPKASQQVEDWRPHLAELRGSFETLEARLSQQLSQQLETQLSGIIQMQLQTHVQPQLQQQLQSQLTQLQDIPGLRETELKHIFQEQVKQLEQKVSDGQQTLRQEAAKREQHLSDLQDAAQRLAETAMHRALNQAAQAAQAFSSSSVMQRLQLVENELQSLQRQEKERHKRRIARLEEDLAQSPMPSPLTSPALSKREVGNDGDVIHRIDELRVQLYAELSDARNVATQLGSRVSRCESEILDLRMQVALNGAEESQTPVRTPSFAQGSPTVEGCPKTPDWASPWQVTARTGLDGTYSLPSLPALQTSPTSPAPSPPLGVEAVNAGSRQYLQGVPEGPQLSSWDGDKAGARSQTLDSPGRVPSTRFGVLPPPKVTTEAPTL
ncbi:unnamed protein product [Durusdinium trenchii]|uniref:Uncharacterized protein n=1 Tax=Durusdinium trenchii TaxID=1381693 RepID=A0ABP0JJH5_9DINO